MANNVPITVNGENRVYNLRLTKVTKGNTQKHTKAILLRDITELEEKRKQLKRQNERLDDFAGILAHDLRNPLSVAKGFAEAAEETGNEDQFQKVHTAHDRMEDMIDDVLTLARQGDTINETEPVALHEIAQEAWKLVDTYNGTLELDLELAVEGDPDRLSNMFENLIRNAIEHTGEDTTVYIVDFLRALKDADSFVRRLA